MLIFPLFICSSVKKKRNWWESWVKVEKREKGSVVDGEKMLTGKRTTSAQTAARLAALLTVESAGAAASGNDVEFRNG